MSRIRIPGKLSYLKFSPFYKGAPQRRLFFPDWYVKMVKPGEEVPKHYVKFHVSHDMTRYDIKEYLEKIYDVPVAKVSLGVSLWVRYRDDSGKWCFMDPYKIAHVRLGKGQTFQFPELLPEEKSDDELNPVEAEEKRREEIKKLEKPVAENDIWAKLNSGNRWLR